MENGNKTTTVSANSSNPATSKMSRWNTNTSLLGFQFFPFITPREWLLIHRIKVVPTIEPTWEVNKLTCGGMQWSMRLSKKEPKSNHRSILLHELPLLNLFNFGKEFIHFMCSWDLPSSCILCSSMSFSWASRSGSWTRGPDSVWVPYQTAWCRFPSAPAADNKDSNFNVRQEQQQHKRNLMAKSKKITK